MANEYKCCDCGKDGTRCDCHKKRSYSWPFSVSEEQQRKTRMEILDWEVKMNLRQMEKMRMDCNCSRHRRSK